MLWIRKKLSALYDKIVKERKSAEFIARGWALGVFIGSVIPFGIQIYIALPLSVGCSSVCELMDFQLLEESVDITSLKDRLNATMPEGISVQEIYEPTRKNAELKWLEIEGTLEYDHGAPEIEKLEAFFAQSEIVIEKKTKRGIGQSDIRPAIRSIAFEPAGEDIRLRAVISAQEPTLNPDLLPSALRQLCPELAPDFAEFTRLETYDAEMRIFR